MAAEGFEDHHHQAAPTSQAATTDNSSGDMAGTTQQTETHNTAAAAAADHCPFPADDVMDIDSQPGQHKRSNSSGDDDAAQGNSKKQKRVTFGENVVLGSTAAAPAAISGVILEVPYDAERAAAAAEACRINEQAAAEARTQKRRAMRWMTDAMDTTFSDYLSELQDAEEEYEQPEELFNSDGIPIEPFHLRRERAEGFFDEEGNYVEHRMMQESDAWLDSLQDGPGDLEADLAARLAAAAAKNDEELPALDEDDAAIYKKRIIDMLQPGENVLQALRRLAAGNEHQSAAAAAAVAAAAAAGERQRKKKKQRLEKVQQQLGSDAPSQQQQQQPPTGQQVSTSPAAAAAAAAAAALSDTPISDHQVGSTENPQKQQSSPRIPVARIPLENRHRFNKLTEYADLLLSNGDVNIYSNSREVLSGQLDMADLAIMLGEDTSDAPIAATAARIAADAASFTPDEAVEAVDMFAEDEEQLQAELSPAAAAAAAAAATDGAAQQSQPDTPSAQEAAAAASSKDDTTPQDAATDTPDNAAVASDITAAAAAAAGNTSIMDGFVLDESSGYYYSSSLGYYFEPSSGLFGDASSGLWYKYQEDSGTYQLVESV